MGVRGVLVDLGWEVSDNEAHALDMTSVIAGAKCSYLKTTGLATCTTLSATR